MREKTILWPTLLLAFCTIGSSSTYADGDLSKVKHIIIIMQENHSFDNYLGVLTLCAGIALPQRALCCERPRMRRWTRLPA